VLINPEQGENMKIFFNNRNIDDASGMRSYISRKAALSFAKTQNHIESVSVTLCDINGPKGGNDKQCKVLIKASYLADIVVVEERDNLLHAIDRCIARANRTLVQQLKRRQHNRQARFSHRDILEHSEQISA
jgi:ribosome-associated translation inhibitor RaiA